MNIPGQTNKHDKHSSSRGEQKLAESLGDTLRLEHTEAEESMKTKRKKDINYKHQQKYTNTQTSCAPCADLALPLSAESAFFVGARVPSGAAVGSTVKWSFHSWLVSSLVPAREAVSE